MRALLIAMIVACALPPVAAVGRWYGSPRHPNVFGTRPLPISTRGAHSAANGDAGGAAVSGDNRKTRLVAFHSAASNLVTGDRNRKTDVFVWRRPRGRRGLFLRRTTGKLIRVSVDSHWQEADGNSRNPSLDGSMTSKPHCVAFQSTATNLGPGDPD